jgi:hypothetical protein
MASVKLTTETIDNMDKAIITFEKGSDDFLDYYSFSIDQVEFYIRTEYIFVYNKGVDRMEIKFNDCNTILGKDCLLTFHRNKLKHKCLRIELNECNEDL